MKNTISGPGTTNKLVPGFRVSVPPRSLLPFQTTSSKLNYRKTPSPLSPLDALLDIHHQMKLATTLGSDGLGTKRWTPPKISELTQLWSYKHLFKTL